MNSNIINTILLYFAVEVIAVYFMYIANKRRNNKRHFVLQTKNISIKISSTLLYIVISFLPLFLLMALKNDSVGTDTKSYKAAYEAISHGTLSAQQSAWLGIGFRSIATIFTFLHIDYHVFFACLSFITLSLFYQTIWKYSKKPALGLFIFISTCLFFQTFNQYRQLLAIALVFFSYNFIAPKRNFPKFLVTIIIAASIHNSALIFLPIYFISKINLTNRTFITYIALTILGHVLYIPLLALISNTHYGQMYFGSYLDLSFKTSTILNLLIRLVLLTFCMIPYKKMLKMDNTAKGMYHAVIICTIIQTFVVRSYTFGRLTTYFFVFYLALIPNILFYIYKNNVKLLYCIMAFFVCYELFYYSSSSAVESGYQTYRFYLEKEAPKSKTI